jgi:hypothetical protein
LGLTTLGKAFPVPPSRDQPFTIHRAPQRVGSPLELTGGACIDLTYSGIGPADNSLVNARTAIAVMFAPAGGVHRLYVDGLQEPPAGALFFLIGRTDKMALPVIGQESNLADADCFWVAVNRLNGKVTSAENAPDPSAATLPAGLTAARSFAIGGEQMGGR